METTPVRITEKRCLHENFTARKKIAFGDITNQSVHDNADKSLDDNLGDDGEVFAFYGDEDIGEIELLFYVSLSRLFNDKPFQPLKEERYEPITHLLYDVFGKHYTPLSLRMYLYRTQRGKRKVSLGKRKAKGQFRWYFYKETIAKCLRVLAITLDSYFSSGKYQMCLETKKTIKEALCHYTSITGLTKKPLQSIKQDLNLPHNFKMWRYSYDNVKDEGHLYYLPHDSGYAKIELLLSFKGECFIWKLIYQGCHRHRRIDEWYGIDKKLLNLDQLKALLIFVESAHFCKGVETIPDAALEKDVALQSKDGHPIAFLETKPSEYHQKVIRSKFCPIFIPNNEYLYKKPLCEFCKQTEEAIQKKYSKSPDISNTKQKRLDLMSQSELLDHCRSQSKKLKASNRKVKVLEKYRKKMIEVPESTDSDLKILFKQLKNGIKSNRKSLSSAACEWSGCQCEKFPDAEALHSHVQCHIDTLENVAPIDRQYCCNWKDCSKSFSKKKFLIEHMREHTGKIQDGLFEILLKDQAKALEVSPKQMRWHPLVIKWCLSQFNKSHAAYEELRKSGVIKLPSGRLLSDYRNYNKPQSGWQMSNLQEMQFQFQRCSSPSNASHIGALAFDEVKIKEGLVFDPSTWELVGFVDVGDDSDTLEFISTSSSTPKPTKENIATHVLQFFFKGLFTKFDYPCAYFLTKNITAGKLNKIFWQGVSLLDSFGFETIMSICDGASENRAFIKMNNNYLDRMSCGYNPYSEWPLVFLSDPPHLMKKLRNNLHKSGDKEINPRFTRLLVKNGKFILWDQIRNVYYRDQKRRMKVTKLNNSSINIDSMSKMKVKLALDVLSRKVGAEMREKENDATLETQKYIEAAACLWDVFSSKEPLSNTADQRLTTQDNVHQYFFDWKLELERIYGTKQNPS